MKLIDMHAHLACLENRGALVDETAAALGRQECILRDNQNVFTCFSAGTPAEWAILQQILGTFEEEKKAPPFAVSFGIHPWNSGDYASDGNALPEDAFLECAFIGEIGMDSVWCDIPLAAQRGVFERQLQIAADLHKPVLLHTKGQEALVAEIIKDFPEKICVHWYSGTERDLEKYLELDCFFTLGPDTDIICNTSNPQVPGDSACTVTQNAAKPQSVTRPAQDSAASARVRIVREAPLQRLFVETDGIHATAWARGKASVGFPEIREVLLGSARAAASLRSLTEEEVLAQMQRNSDCFLPNFSQYTTEFS